MKKIRFSFTVAVPAEKVERYARALLPVVAGWLATVLVKAYPGLENNVQMEKVTVIDE